MSILASVQFLKPAAPDAGVDTAKLDGAIEAEIRRLHAARSGLGSDAQPQVPKFFKPSPEPGSVAALLQAAVHEHQALSQQNLTAEQVEQLKRLLLAHCEEAPKLAGESVDSLPGAGGGANFDVQQKSISYQSFCEVGTLFAEQYGERMLRFFRPSTFLRLQRHGAPAVSVAAFVDYVKAKDYRLYLRRRLETFDRDGDGLLTESDVEALLVSLAEELQYDMARPLFDKWRVIAPRKILFFLAKNGRVRARDLLTSPLLDELVECDTSCAFGAPPIDNWFAPEKSQAIYEKFVELDVDGDGKLSPSELSRLRCSDIDAHERPGSMTDIFLQRVFEVHVHGVSAVTGRPAMDLRDFADFLLAWNLRGEPPSLKYFFKVLDLEHTGRLTAPVVAAFAARVADLWVNKLQLWEYEPLDVKDEIFDMVTPKDPNFITLADLSASGMGDIICGMLVDAQCYYEYDQRERLAQGDGDDS